MAALRGIDAYAMVFPAAEGHGQWRVKDLLAHLATWEREVLASIQAHSEGEAYRISSFDLQRYNRDNYEARKEFDPVQCRVAWGMARRDLQFAIHDLNPARLYEPLTYPSGKRGTLSALIEELVEHEEEHVRDILNATIDDRR
jgi:hypothetical protein